MWALLFHYSNLKQMINKIVQFLEDKPGYQKKGAGYIQAILKSRGIKTSYDDCLHALRSVRTKEAVMDTSATTTGNMRVRRKWIMPDGGVGVSYEAVYDEKETADILNGIKEQVSEHDFIKVEPSTPNDKFRPLVVAIADLHIGALVRNLINTPDYDVNTVRERLADVAREINLMSSQGEHPVHIALLGDILESFTGKSKPTLWKEIEVWGAEAVIVAVEILTQFFNEINGLAGVYMVAGNHDRMTDKNEDDPEREIAHLISHFVFDKLPKDIKTEYHRFLISKEIGGIQYIFTHGDSRFINKNTLGQILFEYGNRKYYNILVTGHLHSRKTKKGTQSDFMEMDSQGFRHHTVPSIFTGNYYSERNGWTSEAGFLAFMKRHVGDKPVVLDIPL